MMLPVTPPVLLKEIASAKEILDSWLQNLAAGIPMVDRPGSEEELEDYIRALCGELLVVAGKCTTLAEVLYGTRE